MDILNMDCLHIILDLLKLSDQLNLVKALPELKPTIFNYWQSKYKNIELNFYIEDLNKIDINIFLNATAATAKSVMLWWCSKKESAVVLQHVFPNCLDLQFFQLGSEGELTDEDLLHIKKCFPNIHTFSPDCVFTGKYISEYWSNIEHLTLTDCNVDFSQLIKLLQNLKLKTLKLDALHEKMSEVNVKDFLNLYQLERILLNVYEYEHLLFKYIIPHLYNLHEFILTDYALPNLKPFASKANDLILAETSSEIDSDLTDFPNLTKLTLLWYLNAEYFKQIIFKNKHLEIIYIPYWDVPSPSKLIIDVSDIVAGRIKPLTIILVSNYAGSQWRMFEVKGKSDLFKVTFQPDNDINCYGTVLKFRQTR